MVWSDPQIIELAKDFLPVADEVYFLYPEDQWNLDRVKNDPGHLFFKDFGSRVPREQWNHPGTKQGVYMIGPDGEFLGARFAASGAPEVRKELTEANQRWQKLRAEKGYDPKPMPRPSLPLPPEVVGKPMILRVSLRDLPDADQQDRGKRIDSFAGQQQGWLDFTRWAWNQNWIAFDKPENWATESSSWTPVAMGPAGRLAREVLVDNVRGQAGPWQAGDVRSLKLEVRRISAQGDTWTLEYRGSAELQNGRASFAPKLVGTGVYDSKSDRFQQFDLVAVGTRTGSWQFNQRAKDQGPSLMGISMKLHR